jgi:hypothetical protein
MHEKLLDAGAIKFSEEYLNEYEFLYREPSFRRFLSGALYRGIVDSFASIKEEKHKTRGMRILKRHLLQFDIQIVQNQPSIKAREALL